MQYLLSTLTRRIVENLVTMTHNDVQKKQTPTVYRCEHIREEVVDSRMIQHTVEIAETDSLSTYVTRYPN